MGRVAVLEYRLNVAAKSWAFLSEKLVVIGGFEKGRKVGSSSSSSSSEASFGGRASGPDSEAIVLLKIVLPFILDCAWGKRGRRVYIRLPATGMDSDEEELLDRFDRDFGAGLGLP